MNSMTETDTRAEYVAGLRALADLLEANTDVPVPTYGADRWQPIRWVITGESAAEQKAAIAAVVRAVGGTWAKRSTGKNDDLFTFDGRLAGLYLDILTHRETVCRRVVTGTREVTATIPPATKEVTVTEDIVEWICEPLLAEATR
jgi:hypothetical protein